jgi:L-lactate dehydrogenase complex protein LldG
MTLVRAGTKEVLSWGRGAAGWASLLEQLHESGVTLLEPLVPSGSQAEDRLARFGAVPVGLTAAAAGLADSGTVVVPSGAGRSQLASLLPPLHLAVVDEDDIHESLETWLPTDGARWLANESAVVLITGPSRTADIELTLTVGVHGPKRVVVFLVRDSA